jgi:hypothetical protein
MISAMAGSRFEPIASRLKKGEDWPSPASAGDLVTGASKQRSDVGPQIQKSGGFAWPQIKDRKVIPHKPKRLNTAPFALAMLRLGTRLAL